MSIRLSSERELLPVVEVVSLIAEYAVGIEDHRPVLVDDDGDLLPEWLDLGKRPVLNPRLIDKERHWSGRIRQGWGSGKLVLRDHRDIRVHDSGEIPFAFVAPSDLAQWLVDVCKVNVELDGVRVEPTPAPAPPPLQKFKREVLVEKYDSVWPSIEADLQDGSRNGLMKAAGAGHGYYYEQRALQWARERDKLCWELAHPMPLNDLPRFVHRTK